MLMPSSTSPTTKEAAPHESTAMGPCRGAPSIAAAIVAPNCGPHNGHAIPTPGQATAFPMLPYGSGVPYNVNMSHIGAAPGLYPMAMPMGTMLVGPPQLPQQMAQQLGQPLPGQGMPLHNPALPQPQAMQGAAASGAPEPAQVLAQVPARVQIPAVYVDPPPKRNRRKRNLSIDDAQVFASPGSGKKAGRGKKSQKRRCSDNSSKTPVKLGRPPKRQAVGADGSDKATKTLKSTAKTVARKAATKQPQLPTPPHENSPQLPALPMFDADIRRLSQVSQASQTSQTSQSSQTSHGSLSQMAQMAQMSLPMPPHLLSPTQFSQAVQFGPVSGQFRKPSPQLPELIPVTYVPTAKRRKRKPAKTPWKLASSPEIEMGSDGPTTDERTSELDLHKSGSPDTSSAESPNVKRAFSATASETASPETASPETASPETALLAQSQRTPVATNTQVVKIEHFSPVPANLGSSYNTASPKEEPQTRSRDAQTLPTNPHDEFLESMQRQSQQWSIKLRQLRRWVQAKEDSLNERMLSLEKLSYVASGLPASQ